MPGSCFWCCVYSSHYFMEVMEEAGGYDYGNIFQCCGDQQMSEGRKTQVVLLDDIKLDILVKPKLYAGELLDMVASYFSLKEKEYFGLAFIDETGHQNWLQLDKRVLEHEFSRKTSQSPLVLFFRIKYFVENITHLKDLATVEAFYLQARSLVHEGSIEVSSNHGIQLSALALQEAFGDYVNDEATERYLKELPVIPSNTLSELGSLKNCQSKISEEHKSLKRTSRGNAIVNFMQVVESLPTYGVHYYEVKDKSGTRLWLSIGYRGIYQYEFADKTTPKKVFLWKQLENLYFRDRKFSIEVYDQKRLPSSRKAFGSGNVSIFVWISSTPALTKSIWSMAIAQHQFYLDRKHNKGQPSNLRTYCDIAIEISRDCKSSSSSNMSRSTSTHSLPALKINGDCFSANCETVELLLALKARKEALEEALHRKCNELKKLCLQEGELTGMLPPEMPLSSGEIIPQTRKRLGSDFSIKEQLSWKKRTVEEKELAKLELEYEIQYKIVTASSKLINDPATKDTLHRQHKLSHKKAQAKLNELERMLCLCKAKVEKMQQEQLQWYLKNDDISCSTSQDSSIQYADNEKNDPKIERIGSKYSLTDTSSSSPFSSVCSTPCSNSVPSSPVKLRHKNSISRTKSATKSAGYSSSAGRQGYVPNSLYQTVYRSQQYPTLPTSLSAGAVLEYCDKRLPNLNCTYQNRFESSLDIDGSNLYSVPTRRTSQAFDTQDDIVTSFAQNQKDLGLMSRHNSLDRSRLQSFKKHQRTEQTKPNEKSFLHTSVSYNEHLASSISHQPNLSQACSIPLTTTQPNHLAYPRYDGHHPHYYHHHSPTPFQVSNFVSSDSLDQFSNLMAESVQATNVDLPSTKSPLPHSRSNIEDYTRHGSHGQTSESATWTTNRYISNEPDVIRTDRQRFDPDLGLPNAAQSPLIYAYVPLQKGVPLGDCRSKQTDTKVTVIRSECYRPYWEETKPYEMSDFYKYSTRLKNKPATDPENMTVNSAGDGHSKRQQNLQTESNDGQHLKAMTHSASESFVRPQQRESWREACTNEKLWPQSGEFSSEMPSTESFSVEGVEDAQNSYLKLRKLKKTTLV